MDPVTHTLVGAAVGQAFFSKKSKAAVPLMALASNLPDIDGIVMMLPVPAAVTWRRTFGHSLFLLPVWVWIAAKVAQRVWKGEPFPRLFWYVALSCALHLLFDLINSFGVLLLWPLDWRPELASVFIIDLALTGLLLLAYIAGRHKRLHGRLGLALAAAYLGLCFGLRARAVNMLEQAREDQKTDFTYVFPEPYGPGRFRGVARAQGRWDVYLLDTSQNSVELRETLVSDDSDPRVAAAKASPLGRRLEKFFKAPVWQAGEDGTRAFDLRFRTLLLERQGVFEYRLAPTARPAGS